ncbi:hypothetical protein ABEH33_13725 [Pantoea agglomerans]|uniref:hypothetical protein n=1 Tax=Enterobacter agglomerans TaxID=549 RepID=UPI00320B31C5
MHLKIYLKALLSGFNGIFEFFGKVQSLATAVIAVFAIFYTANFTAYLEPIKPYYPQILIAVAFVALFFSGYKTWFKEYVKNIVKGKEEVVINNTRADLTIQSTTLGIKLSSLRLHLNFLVTNRKKYLINIKQIDIRTYLKDIGLNSADSISSHPSTLPMPIEPNEAGEMSFSCAIDLRSADFKQQLEIIKDLPNRNGFVKAYIYSVDGFENYDIPILIDNTTVARNVRNADYKFDKNFIELVLGL